eukprot:8313977-Karenia_brevis.AAC.1
MSMSRFQQRLEGLLVNAHFKSCSNLDTLRGSVGTKDMPLLHDDGKWTSLPEPKQLAFLDVSAEEASTVERWDCTHMVQGQCRLWAENPYDE